MADERAAPSRGAVDHVLDLFVFAPLGFMVESSTLVPRLAESGRQRLDGQVQLARMVGQFAVQHGRRRAATALDQFLRKGAETEPTPGVAASGTAAPPDQGGAAGPAAAEVDAQGDIVEEDLAIPSYDSLAASQVVPRLEGLAPVELEAVRRYELAHRGRKTVLGKITLLQSRPE